MPGREVWLALIGWNTRRLFFQFTNHASIISIATTTVIIIVITKHQQDIFDHHTTLRRAPSRCRSGRSLCSGRRSSTSCSSTGIPGGGAVVAAAVSSRELPAGEPQSRHQHPQQPFLSCGGFGIPVLPSYKDASFQFVGRLRKLRL